MSLNTEELALLRKFYPDSLTWELVAANSELESRSDALIREGKLVLKPWTPLILSWSERGSSGDHLIPRIVTN